MFPTFNDADLTTGREHVMRMLITLRKLWESVIGGKGEENYVSASVLNP